MEAKTDREISKYHGAFLKIERINVLKQICHTSRYNDAYTWYKSLLGLRAEINHKFINNEENKANEFEININKLLTPKISQITKQPILKGNVNYYLYSYELFLNTVVAKSGLDEELKPRSKATEA